jgi:glycosyltransferase involved in cell wall biosynthesis
VKKIYVNGKFFSQRVTGTQRYARELLDQFDQLLSSSENGDVSIEILVPRSARSVPNYRNLRVQSIGRLDGVGWEQLELARHCHGELLFTPSGGAPVLYPRNVVTIHDAAVSAAPEGYSLPYRLWYRSVCRKLAPNAQHIFTDSQFSKSEIVKWYGAKAEKVSVSYLGSDHFSRLQSDPSIHHGAGITGKYVLAVSSHNPNKNFQRVVQAVQHLRSEDIRLVIAGAPDSRIYKSGASLPNGAQAVGYVSDAQLKSLYENAVCFVFPSLYEGFGLPPLEAMAAGCPVVVSRAASLPEIFDGFAVICDPYCVEDIAAAIQQAIQSPPASRDQLRSFAARFTWGKCARETLEILKHI